MFIWMGIRIWTGLDRLLTVEFLSFFFFLIRRKVRNASFYSCVFPREQKKVEGRMLYIWMYVRFGDESLMSLDGMEIDVIEGV